MLSSVHTQLPIRDLLGEAMRLKSDPFEEQKEILPPNLARVKDLPDQRVPLLKLTEEMPLARHSQGDHHTRAGG